jgi:hypothetical protein
MSSLNRLNRTGTTNKPVKLEGAEREILLALVPGRPGKTVVAVGY